MLTVLTSTIGLLGFAVLLTIIILGARRVLVPSTPVPITINHERHLTGHFGDSLLRALTDNDIHVPSACAGAGTCGLCRVHIDGKAPEANPIEKALLPTTSLETGERLACQISLRESLAIHVPENMLSTHSWSATVLSSRALSSLIRELRLSSDTETLSFEPGNFIQVTAPAGTVLLSEVEPGVTHRENWERLDLHHLGVHSDTALTRAYSLANRPEDADAVTLMVRLALAPQDTANAIPPGFVSSWLFTREVGDTVELSGPHAGFHVVDEMREMVFVGGGVGMAPLRSMIHRQLSRPQHEPLTFFYGARTDDDLLYREEFDALSEANNGFHWTAALSEPDADWQGEHGFIHTVLDTLFLEQHPACHSCDYYLCGPPLMIKAVVTVLHDAGVQDAHIHKDEF
jgi:Na+-transporting NADH:ubiquinone oxidoreductase subunit F